MPRRRGKGVAVIWSPRPLIQVIQGVWDCREKGPTHRKTPGAETWQEKGDEKDDHSINMWHISGKVSYLSSAVTAWADHKSLTCRGRPACVGWGEGRAPLIPSNYTAVYSVWWCLSAVAVASMKHLHTGYLNPSSLGPTHLWNTNIIRNVSGADTYTRLKADPQGFIHSSTETASKNKQTCAYSYRKADTCL